MLFSWCFDVYYKKWWKHHLCESQVLKRWRIPLNQRIMFSCKTFMWNSATQILAPLFSACSIKTEKYLKPYTFFFIWKQWITFWWLTYLLLIIIILHHMFVCILDFKKAIKEVWELTKYCIWYVSLKCCKYANHCHHFEDTTQHL
jgi:hypothetical protein